MKKRYGISAKNRKDIIEDFNYLFKDKTITNIQIKGFTKNEYGYTQIYFECEEEYTNET